MVTRIRDYRGGIVLNRHERRVQGDYEEVADLLASLAGQLDRVWPGDRWPALVMNNDANPGSAGGHGFVRYWVESAERGRIVMRFDPKMRLDGTHTFSVEAAGSESIVRHVIDASPSSIMKLLWSVLIEPLHDALTEDAFDNIEAAVAGRTVTRSTLTGPVRRRRRLMAMLRPKPIPKDAAGSLARAASLPTAAMLAGVAILHAAWARGSTWPYPDAATFVRSVIGSSNPAKSPGPGASMSVAALLAVSTLGVAARPRASKPAMVLASDLVTLVTSVVLAARGTAGVLGSATGLFRTTTEFRRNDLRFYAPLCLSLALGATLSRRARPSNDQQPLADNATAGASGMLAATSSVSIERSTLTK
jgi:Protein of unknown function (DUF3995)